MAVIGFVNQHITHILALGGSAQRQACGQFGGQILQAMHGNVGFLPHERHFQFLGEQSLG